MEYLIAANRCCVRFLGGEREGIGYEWESLQNVVDRIPYPIARFLIRRHLLLRDVLAKGEVMSPAEFDGCLVIGRRPELGPMWDQLGRGLRMPEVEWWS